MEYTAYPVRAAQTSLDTSNRALEGVCALCTNQAHYSVVHMCTPCSKPHPPPKWRSRSGVVVTSYDVLIGLGTGAVHTHMVHIYACRYSTCIFVPLHHPVLSLIPQKADDTSFAASRMICITLHIVPCWHLLKTRKCLLSATSLEKIL